MAILDNHGGIYGKAGTVVYRRYRGLNIIQGLPKRGRKHSSASKASACEFGLASTTACVLREAFEVIHRHLYDGGLVNRFNSAAYRSILACRSKGRGERDIHDGDVTFLEGLEFNINSRFSDVVRMKPSVSRNEAGQIVVKIPPIDGKKDIRLPARTVGGDRYVMKFVLIAFNFREGFFEYQGIKQLSFSRNNVLEGQELVFGREIPKGCFLALSVSFVLEQNNPLEEKWESMNSLDFNPGMILAAFPADDEAEAGYGDERIGEDLKEAKATGRPSYTIPISGYQGKALLEKMKKLSEMAGKPKKRRRQVEFEDPVDTDPGEGKRVNFSTWKA